ncbi:MAG: metalloregulator ArsR/SmtB family transcription factor [Acidobacteria bacterium]|nr:metalloregulator ArsR/SmtB family transcription factor [Acidobacteriota bacterium]
MKDLARIFKALADETRLAMLAMILRHGELCVCDFENVLAVTQSKASRHLRYLLNAGILADRREGVWVYYRLADDFNRHREALRAALDQTLDSPERQELDERLQAWRRQKACPTPSCG